MKDRRTLSSSLSADVVQYLRRRRHSQAKIAKLLGVSEGFISLVKSRERSLTIEHLELLAEKLSIPLGALLLAVTPLPKGANPEVKAFFELSASIINKTDVLRDMLLKTPKPVRP